MVRSFSFAACLALVAFTFSACSRDKASPQPVAQPAPAPAPQDDSDSVDDEEFAADDPAPLPRISLEPSREVRTPSGFTPEPAEQAEDVSPPEPSIFRSLGRALRRGLTDTVKQAGAEGAVGESPSDPQATEPESPEQ